MESEPGRGSTFSLIVDYCADVNVRLINPVLMPLQLNSDSDADLTLSARILVTDDRNDIRFVITSILKKAGAIVSTASGGREAIETVRKSMETEDQFDVVFMDMQMPETDGYEAARAIRELGFDRPIVALTAHAMQGDRERCLAAGCTEYLVKPIDKAELLKTILRLVQQ